MVHCQIRGNAIQPSGELGAGFVVLARAIDAQKNLLRQILRHRRVMRHAVHKTHHRSTVFLHQVVESRIVASLHFEHHLRISQFARHARLDRKLGLARSAPHREHPAIDGDAAHIRINPARGKKLRILRVRSPFL